MHCIGVFAVPARASHTDVVLIDPNDDFNTDANVLKRYFGFNHLKATAFYMKRMIFHYMATESGKMVDPEQCMNVKYTLLKIKENVDLQLERIEYLEGAHVRAPTVPASPVACLPPCVLSLCRARTGGGGGGGGGD